MGRIQEGRIYEASGKFYVQYRVTLIIDGESKRVQRSQFLCEKDDQHYSAKARSVKLLRDEFMLTVNSNSSSPAAPTKQIAEFWEHTYLPFAEEHLRPATLRGYKQIWSQHLKAHFRQMTLTEYRTPQGSTFLTALAKAQGRRTLQHIRSLASGIFTHAVNLGLIDSNPWHDVKILGKTKAPRKSAHYTLAEVEDIIRALSGQLREQTIVALAFFQGLRPSEIAGLQWPDVDADWLHIRRAVVLGQVGETKTPESVASLPLIQPAKGLVALWREQSGNPEGWVFPNTEGGPINLANVVGRIIKPVLKDAGLKWKSLYAGRRGAATMLVDLTGSLVAAQELLRHKDMTTTAKFYKMQTQDALTNGMKLLEAKGLRN